MKEMSKDKQDVDSERKKILTSLDQSTYLESKRNDPLGFLRQSDEIFVSFPTKNIYYLNEENLSENEMSDRSQSTEKHSADSSSQNDDDLSDNDNDQESVYSSTSFIINSTSTFDIAFFCC
jgi:nucleosome binding factor SPN SPT16 subunit